MLTLDYAGCLASRIGPEHGIADDEIAGAGAQLAAPLARLAAGEEWPGQRWRGLPREEMRAAHLAAVAAIADRHRAGLRNVLVLGIGGSALGAIAVHGALAPRTWNLLPDERRGGPRLFVLDNVDPCFVADALDFIRADDPGFSRTLVNVVSKSGETAETAAQFMIVRDMLGAAGAERIVATTDPERGTMRTICDREGYATLPVPAGVGGRFSVLSPVGLLPLALCGHDVAALLDGAAAMDDLCRAGEATRNPAALLAWLLTTFAQRYERRVHVLMPYANALLPLADWWRQLWAESLGKRTGRGAGQVLHGATPLAALGATDQHSQVQLLRDGPHDHVVGFLEIESFDRDVAIPGGLGIDALAYLEGSSLGTLLAAEHRATAFALAVSERPAWTIRFPRLDAFHVGAFIQLWQLATAVAGDLLGVDAFDQPAVETGKQATFGLMGRAGFESWRRKVEDLPADPSARI